MVAPNPKHSTRSARNPAVRKALQRFNGKRREDIAIDKPLTEQQRIFVREWARGESIYTASVRAGYNDRASAAYKLVKQPNVQALYRAEKEKYEEACQMTRKRVMEGLLEGVEMAKMTSEPNAMIAGWREIGRLCGYYEPTVRKIDLTVTGNLTMQRLEKLSDAELLKLISSTVTEGVEEVLALEGDGE